jgi:hypothetical protein
MGVEQQLMDHLAAVVDFQEGYAAAPAPWYAAVPTDFGGGTPSAMPKLKDAFKVERNAGNEHVASFSTLRALEPQWVGQVWHDPANNNNLTPKYIFYTGQPDLVNGGPCPEPIPTLGVTPFTWPGLP